MRAFISLAAIAVILAGCASTGNQVIKTQTSDSVKAQITEGATTKADVQKKFGSATSTSFTDSGNEIWTYKFSAATPHASNFIPIVGLFASGADVETKELVVMFNKENVVQKYTFRESKEQVKSGILGKQ